MEQRLDVSELEPPGPLEKILAALEQLPASDWLRVSHRREPFPLYNMLRQMDFVWDTKWQNGECIITIWHKGHLPAEMQG